jgi:F-type H+-transporting ATPase subunit delta
MHLNLDVDPEVLGGISVRIGDEVIDGSIRECLDEANRQLGGR